MKKSAAFLALVLLTFACGNTTGGSGSNGTPKQGGTLVIGNTEEPDYLNPVLYTLATSYDVVSAIDDPMAVIDNTGKLVPRLATSWDVAPDGLTYTFHLRQGVTWQDGQPFTADDVKFTYESFVNPNVNAISTSGWSNIDRLDTPDPYTVIYHLKSIYAAFLETVAPQPLVPRHILGKSKDFNKDPYNRMPIGTGPFQVTEWKSADHITLTAYPNYWGGKPKLDRIIFRIVPDQTTLLNQLKTGEVNLAYGMNAQQIGDMQKISNHNLSNLAGLQWYHIDLKQVGFLRETVVRQALDYATPKKQIVQSILRGAGDVAYGDQSPISWAYEPNVTHHDYDIAKAKQMLADDGFTPGSDGTLQKNGTPFVMTLYAVSGDPVTQQVVQVIDASWAQVGIKMNPPGFQDANALYSPNGPQFNKNMTGLLYSWFNTNDPSDTYFWNSSQIPTNPQGGGGNIMCYYNKFSFQDQIDQLTNAQDATVDKAKRKEILSQIQKLLADQVPDIFLWWNHLISSSPTNFHGWEPAGVETGYFWNAVDWYYTT
jgi:peptide/nickel transport system substrate-binding protein